MNAHLTREQLVLWRDRGDESDRATVVAHLASCDDCSGLYAQLVRERPPETGPERFNPADFVKTGRAVHSSPRRATWRWMSAGLGVATVALVVAFFLAPDRSTISNQDLASAGERGSSLELIRPVGGQRAVADFAWTSPVAATDYLVEVNGPNGNVLRETVTTEVFTPGPELIARLEPGREYRWKVSARNAHGIVIMTSNETTFVLGGASPR